MEHAHVQTEVCTLLATMSTNAGPSPVMVGYLAHATSQMSPWIISRVLWSNATLLLHRHHHRRHLRRHHRHRRHLRHSHLGMIMSKCLHQTSLRRSLSRNRILSIPDRDQRLEVAKGVVFWRLPQFLHLCLSMQCILHSELCTMYQDSTRTVV